MNHNFADWELTQMLPETNSYLSIKYFWYIPYTIIEERGIKVRGKKLKPILKNRYENEVYETHFYYYTRDAWSWEDIRLYLMSKGYILGYRQDVWDEHYHNIPIYYWANYTEGYIIKEITCNSYEEARREAIIYCLKLINNDTIKTS